MQADEADGTMQADERSRRAAASGKSAKKAYMIGLFRSFHGAK